MLLQKLQFSSRGAIPEEASAIPLALLGFGLALLPTVIGLATHIASRPN